MSEIFPFHNRPELWSLYQPLVGQSMLELGDKLDGGRVYKAFFESIGFRHVSVDLNGNNGAMPLDLTGTLDLGTFDMVTNIGTSEHVSEDNFDGQIQCWKNIVGAMHVGSVLICDTPMPGHWKVHGTWYPTAEFYREFAEMNGMELQRISETSWRPGRDDRKVISARMLMQRKVPFAMPNKRIYRNGAGGYF